MGNTVSALIVLNAGTPKGDNVSTHKGHNKLYGGIASQYCAFTDEKIKKEVIETAIIAYKIILLTLCIFSLLNL